MAQQVRVSPQQGTAKWQARIQAATQEIMQGVERVQTAPGVLAAAKFQKWVTGVQEAQQKWRRNVSRVSLQEWQDSMKNVGIPRIAQGAQQKAGKVERFQAEFFPFLEQGMRQINAMPDNTLEDRIAKSAAMQRYNAGFKRGGGQAAGMGA